MDCFGIVTAEHCYLREAPGESADLNGSEITDEIFSGWAVRLFPGTEKDGWIRVLTHYGYEGYVSKSALRQADRRELEERQDTGRFRRIGVGEADLLSLPKVQGLPLELLMKNALVEWLADAEGGWSLVRTAAGREGYVHTCFLQERKDSDHYLLAQESPAEDGYFLRTFLENPPGEENLRAGLVRSALSYLGVQYRWGGKSSQGIDCSGLAFMCYLENGVLIYRDAGIVPGYPVREVPKEMIKPGDLLFFPGHVAMYLGGGRYIHSTGYEKTPCVTVNSLDPGAEDYREDLARKLTACGSVFLPGSDRASAGARGKETEEAEED